MIPRIDRLVGGAVLTALLGAWLLFLGVGALGELLDVLGRPGASGRGIADALTAVALTMPRRAYEYYPFATILGTLLGLGALAVSSELTALRAAGASRLRIAGSAMLACSLLLVPVMFVAETLGPWGERAFHNRVFAGEQGELAIGRWSGVWMREGERFFNARRGVGRWEGAQTRVELADLRVFEFDDSARLRVFYSAERGEHLGDSWRLIEVWKTEFEAEGVIRTHLPEFRLPSAIDPQLIAAGLIRPRYQSLADIRRNLEFLQANRLDAQTYEAAYWLRLSFPINVLGLSLVAVPFAFGALRSGGFGKRVFLGMILVIMIFLVQRMLLNLAEVYHLNMAAAAILPSLLIPLAVALWLRFRA